MMKLSYAPVRSDLVYHFQRKRRETKRDRVANVKTEEWWGARSRERERERGFTAVVSSDEVHAQDKRVGASGFPDLALKLCRTGLVSVYLRM